MTAKRWDFRDEDLRRYSVEIEHAVLTGDRRISVNGREVFHGGKFFDTGGEHVFDLEGHTARLRIGSTGFAYNYTLVVDGLTIPPEGATIPRPARNANSAMTATWGIQAREGSARSSRITWMNQSIAVPTAKPFSLPSMKKTKLIADKPAIQ